LRQGWTVPCTVALAPASTSSLRRGTGMRAATVTRCEALRVAVVATGVAARAWAGSVSATLSSPVRRSRVRKA
jgi:hypothetical protein